MENKTKMLGIVLLILACAAVAGCAGSGSGQALSKTIINTTGEPQYIVVTDQGSYWIDPTANNGYPEALYNSIVTGNHYDITTGFGTHRVDGKDYQIILNASEIISR